MGVVFLEAFLDKCLVCSVEILECIEISVNLIKHANWSVSCCSVLFHQILESACNFAKFVGHVLDEPGVGLLLDQSDDCSVGGVDLGKRKYTGNRLKGGTDALGLGDGLVGQFLESGHLGVVLGHEVLFIEGCLHALLELRTVVWV